MPNDNIAPRSHANGNGENGIRKALTLGAMSLGFGVVQLDVTIVNTALNSIADGFGGDVAALQWVVNSYTIAFAALILTAGALGDRIGAKRVFLAGFCIFTCASLGCALAPNLATLIGARALQGLGAAILVPNSLALLNHAYTDPAARGRAVGFWAAGASLALTAGPFAGGVLIALVGWRAIFLVNLPIGLLGLALTWRFASETPRAERRELDLPGQAAAVLALGLLAAAIIEGGKIGWTSSLVVAGFAGAILIGAMFVMRERHTPQPMLPPTLFSHALFTLATLIGVLVNIAFYGLIFVLSLYFQQMNGWSPFVTGLAFLPMMAMVLPVNLAAPRLSERIGAPAVIAIGASVAAVGAFALLFLARGTNYGAMVVQLTALGAGIGLLVPPMTTMLLGSVDKAYSGVASGVLNSARQSGSVIGVALFGAFVAQENAFLSGLRLSLIVAAALFICAAALASLNCFMRSERRSCYNFAKVPLSSGKR